MTLTETEAREKWCPMAQPAEFIHDCDDPGKDDRAPKCIASRCMMWREAERSETIEIPAGEKPIGLGWQSTGNTIGKPRIVLIEYARTIRGGFCGLAGRP